MSELSRAALAGFMAFSLWVSPAAADLAAPPDQRVLTDEVIGQLHALPAIGDVLHIAERLNARSFFGTPEGRGLWEASNQDTNPLESLGVGTVTGLGTGGVAGFLNGLNTAAEAQILQNSENAIVSALNMPTDLLSEGIIAEAEGAIAEVGAAQFRRAMIGGAAGLLGGLALGYGLDRPPAPQPIAYHGVGSPLMFAYPPVASMTTITISIPTFGK